MTLRHLCRYRGPAPLVPDILAKAALALRDTNQHELADIVTLLALLATTSRLPRSVEPSSQCSELELVVLGKRGVIGVQNSLLIYR
jgi:hypothetical protein